MAKREKGKSPFHPGQPVPPELFVGRREQIAKILQRGAAQVANGKPIAMYVQGEYGIGKSSIAGFAQRVAERDYRLLRVYVNLGGAQDIDGLAAHVLEATVRSGARSSTAGEHVRHWLSKYIGKQQLLGLTLNLEALKADAPSLATTGQMLGFLRETLVRSGESVRGIFLVLDELNGIVNEPQFAHFITGLVEENAMAAEPLPLLLMLCGVEERRRTMIRHHPPVDRIFDIIDIEKMSQEEMEECFTKSFADAEITVTPGAMHLLTHYSAGFPKVMHVVGDEAYFADTDWVVDDHDANRAVLRAADEIGRKFVDQQVYKALRSPDYHSILQKIAARGPDSTTFTKKSVLDGLTPAEKKKLDNFLQRMKKLNVIRSGDTAGEYVFNVQMVRLYIWLKSLEKSAHAPAVAGQQSQANAPDAPSTPT